MRLDLSVLAAGIEAAKSGDQQENPISATRAETASRRTRNCTNIVGQAIMQPYLYSISTTTVPRAGTCTSFSSMPKVSCHTLILCDPGETPAIEN